MDKVLAKKYLSWVWVKFLCPGGKNGITWDKAGSCVRRGAGSCKTVRNRNWTALCQEDLYNAALWYMAKQSFQKYVQEKLYEYKNSLGLSTGKKVNVPREQIISWIEQVIAHLNEMQKKTRKVASIFAKCRLDSYDMEKNAFSALLQTLCENNCVMPLLPCE